MNKAKEAGNKATNGYTYISLGSVYNALGDLKKAKEFCQLGLGIAQETGNRDCEGQGYNTLGCVYHSLGDFRKAKEFCQLGLGIAQETGNRDSEGLGYNNLGGVYSSLGDPKKAMEFYRLGLGIAQETGNRASEGSGYNNLGGVYRSLGDLKKAMEFYRLALGIAQETGNRHFEGRRYNNLGCAYHSLGDIKKAMELFRLGLGIAKETGDRDSEGTGYNNLGSAYNSLGDFKKAMEFYRLVLGIAKETGDRASEGRGYNNLGGVYSSLGDPKKAMEFYLLGLGIAQDTGNRNLEGCAYINLGFVYHSLGDLEKAMKSFRLGLKIAKETGNRNLEGSAYNNLGGVYDSLGDLEKAMESYRLGLGIAKETGNRNLEGYAYNNLGSVYESLNDVKKAIAFYQLGLGIAKETGDRELKRHGYSNLARSYYFFGDIFKAEEFGKSCVKLVEKMRVLLQGKDAWKIHVRDESDFSFRILWRLQLQKGKTLEALFTAETGRAQALMDLMKSQFGVRKTIRNSSKPQMDLTISSISSHITSPTLFLAEDTNINAVYFWLLLNGEQFNFFEKEVSDDLTLLTHQAYEEIGVSRGVKCKNHSLDEPEVKEIEIFSERGTELTSQQVEGGTLRTLYDMVIAPFSHLIEGDELIIVPDRSSFFIPYAALMDQHSRHLSEKLRIRLAPSLISLRLLAECPEGRHSASGALLVGNPWLKTVRIKNSRPFKQLPGAEKEVKLIGQILNIEPLTGMNATKDQLLSRLPSVSLVHMATHGCAKTGEIYLSPNPASMEKHEEKDSLLTMAEVLDTQLHAKLVVLSCCHTARGEIKAEGVVGMARAFLGAGARSVIASLWELDDEATLEFMRLFYEHLVAGKSASKSLHHAMKRMRELEQFNAVKYWAPFVLIGDDVTLNFGQ